MVTIERAATGAVERVSAGYDADAGRWKTGAVLEAGDVAYVDRGCVTDTFGEFNGARSGAVSTAGPAQPGDLGSGCPVEGPDLRSELPGGPPGTGSEGDDPPDPSGSGSGGDEPGAVHSQPMPPPATASGGQLDCGRPHPGNHVVGTSKRERLVGTPGVDIICGFGGRDRLRGLGADDLLLGGRGKDSLIGGAGFDLCHGGGGMDRRRRCEDGL
jgi:hypothetical protein